jgi:hypothetical protein
MSEKIDVGDCGDGDCGDGDCGDSIPIASFSLAAIGMPSPDIATRGYGG